MITGQSDNGKTAVLRALRWVLYNEPNGVEFVRHGTRECRVEVTMSDGTVIARERTPKLNRYTVTAADGTEQVFEGFGPRVPAEVLQAHGMAPVALDTDHKVLLNVGGQLEGPFLLSESPSARARAIGRLLGVHIVDAAARTARRDLQWQAREEKAAQAEIARLDQELQAFAALADWEQALAEAETLHARAQALTRRVETLQRLGADLAAAEQALATEQDMLARLHRLYPAEQKCATAADAAARLERLQEFQARWDDVTARLDRGQEELADSVRLLRALAAEYAALLRSSGRCPTCFSPVTAATQRRLVQEIAPGEDATHAHPFPPADAGLAAED